MARQDPYKSTGFPDKRLTTCSPPVKGANRGCPVFAKCTEVSKGTYPVRVAYKDYTMRRVRFMSCVEWQKDGRYVGDEHYERCAAYPGEYYRVERKFQYPQNARGDKGEIIQTPVLTPSPSEAILETHPVSGTGRPEHDLLEKQFGEDGNEKIRKDPRGGAAGSLGNREELPASLMLQDSEVSFDDGPSEKKPPVQVTVPGVRIVGGAPVDQK